MCENGHGGDGHGACVACRPGFFGYRLTALQTCTQCPEGLTSHIYGASECYPNTDAPISPPIQVPGLEYQPQVQLLRDISSIVECDTPLTMTVKGSMSMYPAGTVLVADVPDITDEANVLFNCSLGVSARNIIYSEVGAAPGTVKMLFIPAQLDEVYTYLNTSVIFAASMATSQKSMYTMAGGGMTCAPLAIKWEQDPGDETDPWAVNLAPFYDAVNGMLTLSTKPGSVSIAGITIRPYLMFRPNICFDVAMDIRASANPKNFMARILADPQTEGMEVGFGLGLFLPGQDGNGRIEALFTNEISFSIPDKLKPKGPKGEVKSLTIKITAGAVPLAVDFTLFTRVDASIQFPEAKVALGF